MIGNLPQIEYNKPTPNGRLNMILKTPKTTLFIIGTLMTPIAFANEVIHYGKQDDRHIQDSVIQKQLEMTHPIAPRPTLAPATAPTDNANTVSMSAEELGNHPDLVVRAIAMAVLQNNFDNVAFLLPYYEKLPKHAQETVLLEWARGMMAERQGNAKQAVRHYRIALSENGEAGLLRLRLAIALFANKEYDASEDQFTKILSEDGVPPDVAQVIQDYLTAIKRQNRLSISGGINYLADKNINNAPSNPDLGGGWTAPAPQSAHGVGFNLNLDKKWGLPEGFFGQTRLDTSGKYYTDNKAYNELTVRLSAGMGHADARHSFALLPFVEKSYYAGDNDNNKLDAFSEAKGVSAEWSYWITPKWQTSLHGEVAEQDYDTRIHLNGLSRSASGSVLYLPNAQRYYFAGLDFNRTNTRDGDDSFVRRGLRVGVGQELGYGFSTRVIASVAEKDYKDAGFFGKIQQNDEYSASVSLWNKKIHYAGITPRVTWQYQKVDSNLPLYEYDKNKVFVEMSKQF